MTVNMNLIINCQKNSCSKNNNSDYAVIIFWAIQYKASNPQLVYPSQQVPAVSDCQVVVTWLIK